MTVHPEKRREFVPLGVGILALVLFVAAQVAWVAEPFDQSKAGIVGADDFAYTMRAFDTHGIGPLKMRAATFFLASTPDGYEARDSHPAPAYGIYYLFHHLFGGDEAALRVLSILLCLSSCVGIGWLAVQGGDRPGPSIALLALSPAFIQYGNMVDFSMFTVGLAPLCAVAWFRHRYGGGGLGLFMGLGFLCGATSWYSFFLVPAIWLEIVAGRPRPSRPWRSAFLVGLPFGIAVLAHLAYWLWAIGGFEALMAQLVDLSHQGVGTDAFARSAEARGLSFAGAIADHMVNVYGPVLLAVAGLGCLICLGGLTGRGESRRERVALTLLLTGSLMMVTFWSRTGTHQFLAICMAPGIALAATHAAHAIGRQVARVPGLSRVPAVAHAPLLAILVLQVLPGLELRSNYAGNPSPEIGRALTAATGKGDVVFLPVQDYTAGLNYYADMTLISMPWARESFDWCRTRLRPLQKNIGRLYCVGSRATLMNLAQPGGSIFELPFKLDGARMKKFGDREWVVVELDSEAFFSERPK